MRVEGLAPGGRRTDLPPGGFLQRTVPSASPTRLNVGGRAQLTRLSSGERFADTAHRQGEGACSRVPGSDPFSPRGQLPRPRVTRGLGRPRRAASIVPAGATRSLTNAAPGCPKSGVLPSRESASDGVRRPSLGISERAEVVPMYGVHSGEPRVASDGRPTPQSALAELERTLSRVALLLARKSERVVAPLELTVVGRPTRARRPVRAGLLHLPS